MKDEKTPGTIDPVREVRRAKYIIQLARDMYLRNASPLVHDSTLDSQLLLMCFKCAAKFVHFAEQSDEYKLALLDRKFGLDEVKVD